MKYGELNSKKALSMLLAGAVMISFSSVWVKICQVSPISSAFYRVLFGGLILSAVVFYNRELKWQGRGHFLLILLCALFFALDLVLYIPASITSARGWERSCPISRSLSSPASGCSF